MIVGLLTWFALTLLPSQHNPLEPLHIDDPLGVMTDKKLSRLSERPGQCFSFLDDSEIIYTRLAQSPAGQNCGFYDALTLDRSLISYSTPLQMTCGLTSALAIWERQSLMLRTKEFFDSPPSQILSLGSFSCRRLYGRKKGAFSEHATGNAIDIRGIELQNGKIIRLDRHWGSNTTEGRYLKALRDDACRIFGTVLGPDYNAAHADHFHFDMSQSGICS